MMFVVLYDFHVVFYDLHRFVFHRFQSCSLIFIHLHTVSLITIYFHSVSQILINLHRITLDSIYEEGANFASRLGFKIESLGIIRIVLGFH